MANRVYSDKNRSEFIGRVVRDAEAREVMRKDGTKTAVTSFTVACNKSVVSEDGTVLSRRSVFVDVSFWNRPNLAKLVKKGMLIYVDGELEEPRVGSNGKAYNQLRGSGIQFFRNPLPKAEDKEPQGVLENSDQLSVADDNIPF